VDVTASGVLYLRATSLAALTATTGLTNAGAIALHDEATNASASLTVTGGTLVNTGTIQTAAAWGGGTRTITGDLDLRGTLTIGFPLTIVGQLISPVGAPGTVNGNGSTLPVVGLDVDGITFNNTPLVSTGGTITRFDNVTFQNMSVDAVQLTVNHPGATTPFTFDGVQFLTTPSGGRYVRANDTDTGDGNVLTIDMVNSTPANGSAYEEELNGAIINWGAAGPGVNVWTATSGTWSTDGNWSLGRAPIAGDTVQLTQGVDYAVTLDVSPTIAKLTIGGTADVISLNVGDQALTITDMGVDPGLDILPLGDVQVGNGSISVNRLSNNGVVWTTGVALLTASAISNFATWQVAGGQLTVTHPTSYDFQQVAGTLDVASGAELTLGANGALTYFGGGIGGSAAGTFGTITVTANVGLILGADLTYDSLTIQIEDGFTQRLASERLTVGPDATLIFSSSSGGFLNSIVQNQGTMVVLGEQNYANDSLYIAPSGLLLLDGTAGSVGLTVSWGVDNAGGIQFVNTSAGFPAYLIVSPGSLTNRADATIFSQVGDGTGLHSIDAQLLNDGLINLQHDFRLTRAGAQHVNSETGLINVVGGTFEIVQTGIDPTFTNDGTLYVTGGDVLVTQDAANARMLSSGALVIDPSHTMTFGGTSTSGVLDVAAGTLSASGTLVAPDSLFGRAGTVFQGYGTIDVTAVLGGDLSADVLPGAVNQAGTLTFVGDLSQSAASTFYIDLGGTGAGQSDLIEVTGTGTLNGTVDVTSILPTYTPAAGDTIAILIGGQGAGEPIIVLPADPPGLTVSTYSVDAVAPIPDTVYVVFSGALVATVDLTPTGSSLSVGAGSRTLTATPRNDQGDPLSLTGRTVTWRSLNPSIATVVNGTATGIASGQAIAEVTVDGVAAYAVLNVTHPTVGLANVWAAESQGTTAYRDVWGSSGSDVYGTTSSTGTNATGIFRFDGTGWAQADATAGGTAIWGLGPDSVYSVAGTTIYQGIGGTWSTLATGQWTNSARGLWASAPNDIVVVGDAGQISRFDGTAWSTTTVGSSNLQGVWGAAPDTVFAVGNSQTVLRWNGSTWAAESGVPAVTSNFQAVWGTSSADVWVTGSNGVVLHYDGATWTVETLVDTPTNPTIMDVWGTRSDDVYAASSSGFEVWHFDGATWTKLAENLVGASNTDAIWTTSAGEVVATGFTGTRVRGYRNTAVTISAPVTTITTGGTTTWTASATSGGNPISNVIFDWSSLNPAVATVVANSGEITGVSVGSAQIVATARGGAADTVTIDVTAPQPIVFAGDSAGGLSSGIFRVLPDGTGQTRLLNFIGNTDQHPRWAPDNSKIVFTYPIFGPGTENALLAVAADGTDSATVASDTSMRRPRYSRNGTHLAAECGDGGYPFSAQDVCVIGNVPTTVSAMRGVGGYGQRVEVTDAVSLTLGGSGAFAWNPLNDNQLAVVRDDQVVVGGPVASQIWLVNYDGTGVTALTGLIQVNTNQPVLIYSMDWAPDGSFIAFEGVNQVTSERAIFRAEVPSGAVSQLTSPGNGFPSDFRPVVSPASDRILFAREVDGWVLIHIPSTGATEPLGWNTSVFNFSLSQGGWDWSPDGAEVVHTSSYFAGGGVSIGKIKTTTTQATYTDDLVLVGRDGPVGAVQARQPSRRP